MSTNLSTQFGVVPSDIHFQNLFIAEKIVTPYPKRDNSKTHTNVGPEFSFGLVPRDGSYTYYATFILPVYE